MKTNFWRLPALLASLILLFVSHTEGAGSEDVVTNVLPASLPIGGENTLFEYLVTNTNGVSPIVSITLVGDPKLNSYYSVAAVGIRKFTTFEMYENWMRTNAWFLYTNYVLNKRPDVTDVGMEITVHRYTDPTDGFSYANGANPKIGINGSITKEMFTGVKPQKMYVQLPVELDYIKIRIDRDPPYEFSWGPTGTSSSDPTILQGVIKKRLYLHEWYSHGNSRMRFELGYKGQTATYTQFGEKLEPPQLVVKPHDQLEIHLAKGADYSVEASPTLSSGYWAPLGTSGAQGTATSSVIYLQYPDEYQNLFFRAFVK